MVLAKRNPLGACESGACAPGFPSPLPPLNGVSSRRLSAIGTHRRSMSGGHGSCFCRRTASARSKSCIGRGSPRPVSGAGKNVSWRKEPPDCCVTRPAPRESPRCDRIKSTACWRLPPRIRPTRPPIGRRPPWPRRSASARVRSSASGVLIISPRIGSKPSSSPRDPKFAEKLRDVVGLYVDPPAHALVLSFDEKSQIQALDRTQPGLPMKPGRAGTMTHDYKRNGTTTLFAALNVLDGTIIGCCMKRHRHQEFIRFLRTIDAAVPTETAVHLILDNYAAHKHPKVMAWLARHPRFTFHFVPTSCSWLNAVEGFFATLTKRRLRRGVFRSVRDLETAIDRYLDEHNENPKPFVWTASPNRIIAAVKRGHQALDSVH